MRKNYKVITVDKEFHRLLKSRASIEGKTILRFTRELADIDDLVDLKEKKKDKEKRFDFRI